MAPEYNGAMQMHVIGLVGEKGGGKDTFVTYLREIAVGKQIIAPRFSDVLGETLDLWNIPRTRENLQNLAIEMRKIYGKGVLANVVYERICRMTADIIILNGIRWEEDVELMMNLKKLYKAHIVYVTVNPRLRYERSIKRAEKVGESETSFEQFLKEEEAFSEILIPTIGRDHSDYEIVNESSLDYYRNRVVEFYDKFVA